MVPEEALEYADSVVIGEAETVWKQVLADAESGVLQPVYRGEHGRLEGAPSARRDLFNPEYLFSSIQTSRGCPMNCNFCSVTAFNGRRYRQRPVSEVLDELASIDRRYIFFVDDNILGYGKKAESRALELFQGMVRMKLDKIWFCQASVNFGANPEILKWAAKSGCRMVFLGLEAQDREELESMSKHLNAAADYRRSFRNIHRAGIAVLGAFIYGTDSDTAAGIRKKTDYISRSSIDVVQTTTLTPLPGTVLYEKLKAEDRLIYTDYPDDWSRYDMTRLTFRPDRISPDAFYEYSCSSNKRLLSTTALIFRFLRTILLTGSLETAFWAYSSNLVYRKAFQSSVEAVNGTD